MALTDSLISYWTLDEASGTRADSHGSNNLTDNNTVLAATGVINNGADFESANQEYLSITDAAQVGLDTLGDISFSCWIDIETGSRTQIIAEKWHSGTGNRSWIFFVENDNTLKFRSSDDGLEPAVTAISSAISITGFQHVGFSYDASAGSATFYINGVADTTTTGLDTSIFNSSAQFLMGKFENATTLNFDGIIDEAGLWGRIVTADEFSSLYNGGAGLAYPLTVAPAFIPRLICY